MIKNVFFLTLLAIVSTGIVSVIVPSSVFAATVNCDLAVQTCVGTSGADTMIISKLKGNAGLYFIDPKGGDDTVVANLVLNDAGITGFVISPSGGNDKIAVKNPIPLAIIDFFGGDGSDTITYNGVFPGVKTFPSRV